MTANAVKPSQEGQQLEHSRNRVLLELVISGVLGLLVGYRDVLTHELGALDSILGANFGLIGNAVPWAAVALLLGLVFPSRAVRNALCLVAIPAIVSQTMAVWNHGIYNLLPFALFLFVVYMGVAVVTAMIGAAVRRNMVSSSKT